ncbi:MAG: hypothetical protein INQ03_12295 [Candidatus Heimdallarchaeota archaeon]|nr:hypothetical protein [Candidatus Heimdallarchaeota archaeon]
MKLPLIVAHRGASGTCPENTMLAFWTASSTADIIELDVQLTKDSELVVFHDRNLERITGDKGGIADYTLEQLLQKDVGKWMGNGFSERIPTLEQVLSTLPDATSFIIEIKPQGREIENNHTLEQRVIEVLEKDLSINKGYISVRDIDTYEWINSNLSKYPVALMQKKRSPSEFHSLLSEYKIPIAQIRRHTYDEQSYGELSNIVQKMYVYFADYPEEWKFLIERGVDGILTNYPDRLRGYLKMQFKL